MSILIKKSDVVLNDIQQSICYCLYIFIIFKTIVGGYIGGLIGLDIFVTCIYFVCCKRKYNIFVCLKDIIEVGQLWPWPYDMLDLQLPVQPVSITTQLVSSNPVSGEVYSIQHYVIKFVSYLRQVGGVFRFPPSIQLTATISWNIVESGVKHYQTNKQHNGWVR